MAVTLAAVAMAGTTIGTAGTAKAGFPFYLLYNRGNGLCATTQPDPNNGIPGTARFAPCNAGDSRQWWLTATVGPDAVALAAYAKTSRGKTQCMENGPGGWGLAFLTECELNNMNNIRQEFKIQYYTYPDGKGSYVFATYADNNYRLSVPYTNTTSYVSIRDNIPFEDDRMHWDKIST